MRASAHCPAKFLKAFDFVVTKRAIVRFLLAGAILTALAVIYQDAVVNALLPVFRAWLLIVDDTFWTVDLSLVQENGETVVRRLASLSDHLVYSNAPIRPNPDMQLKNSAAAGIVLQPLVLGFALLAAWPWRQNIELACRFAAAALLFPLVVLLDVPMMLYGFGWYELLKVFEPERFSLLVSWADSMNAGGRFALTIVATAICIGLGQSGAKRLLRPGHAPTI